ncbi:MAG: hypothetical protein KGN78_04840 [Actinomycetales bacterium]|nr:hypothetical protein [Actinomycetales bacterium]
MPYKSQAQRRLFHWLVGQGKLAPETAHEYDVASKGKKLPEYVGAKKKAFGGQVEAKSGTRCPACDYALDAIPVAMDAGEGCPRCGYGDAKDVPQKARGGEMMPKQGDEVMEPTTYRARGGEMQCAHCGSVSFVPLKAMGGEVGGPLHGDMKELYPSKKSGGATLDDGKIHPFGKLFASALKRGRG